MAAFLPRQGFQLFDAITPRMMIFMSQKCLMHVNVATSLPAKPEKSPKRGRVLHKTNAKSVKVSPEPRAAAEKPIKLRREPTTQDLLEDTGIKVKALDSKIDVKKLSFAKVQNVLNFLEEIGLDRKDKGKVIVRRPGILTAKEYLLKTRVQTMRSVGINPDSVAYVVKESPGVLTGRTEESLPEKVKFFEDLAVKPKFTKDEILHVLTKCPHIIATFTVESLNDKVQFFEKELKFNKHHIKNLILKQPSVLTFGKETIMEKYSYCYEKINVSPSSIARCPRVFQCSLKRIKERHRFLKHLGRITDEMKIDDYGLGLIVTTPNKQFVEQVAKSTLEEFDQFKENMDSIDSPADKVDSVQTTSKTSPKEFDQIEENLDSITSPGDKGDYNQKGPKKHIEEFEQIEEKVDSITYPADESHSTEKSPSTTVEELDLFNENSELISSPADESDCIQIASKVEDGQESGRN